MEERPGSVKFFFANSLEGSDTLLRFSRGKFTNLFRSGKRVEYNTLSRSFKALVAEDHDNRYVELVWLSGDDPVNIEQLERMPIIDYWLLLNRKYAAIEKQAAQIKRRGGNTR